MYIKKTLCLLGLAFAVDAHAANVSVHDIQSLENRFSSALQQGDADALAALYAKDAQVVPEGAPAVKGQAAIRSFWADGIKDIASVSLRTLDVQPLGDNAAQETGIFDITPKAAGAPIEKGKYVVIWKKQDGTWKLWTDTWNEGR